jgi:hypothetical protein
MPRITDINYFEDWEKPYVKIINTKKGTKNYSLGFVPLDVLIKNQPSKNRKIRFESVCIICGCKFEMLWSRFCRRINSETKMKSICGLCAVKVATNSNEWKKKNSESQLKVQGTPEARKRMSEILKKSRKEDPTISERISKSLKKTYRNNAELRKKISEASKRNWEREEYKQKVSPRGFHHGVFHSKDNGDIYFASSWELMFLVWCEDNKDIIKFGRCKDRITYKKPSGKSARYHPDFEVKFKNETWISEVKGSRSDYDLVSRKREAAKEFYGGESNKLYIMVYKEDLKRLGCFKGERKKLREWIKSLVEKGMVTYYGGPKKEDRDNIQGKSS